MWDARTLEVVRGHLHFCALPNASQENVAEADKVKAGVSLVSWGSLPCDRGLNPESENTPRVTILAHGIKIMPVSPFVQRDEGAPVDVSIASLPCDAGSVPGLLNDISSLGSKRDLSADRNARLDLLEKARSLVRALETPRETMLKHVGAQPLAFICIALGIDVGLFDLMAKNDGSPKTGKELASQLGFDLDPLSMLIDFLSSSSTATTELMHKIRAHPEAPCCHGIHHPDGRRRVQA